MFLYVQKPLLPSLKDGIDATIFMDKDNKNSRLYIRLTNDEHDKLRVLSKDYPSISAFVLDACWHFNGKLHLNKLEYLEKRFETLIKLRSDLNHLSANINQLVLYTNNCIKMGVYLNNTENEIIRLQTELLNNLNYYKKQMNSLEKELRNILRNI